MVPRWCICAAWRPVTTPLQVDVLIHHREYWRPTSTGRLVNRIVAGSREFVVRQGRLPERATVIMPERELWILHPRGETLPTGADPAGLQVVLLDGSWSEAAHMAKSVARWGRLIRLPEGGPSRSSLRRQETPGKFATAESLLHLYAGLGLAEADAALRLQFELHVYAGLRTRGASELAAEFLAGSPIREAFPELLADLHRRRARD
jgi:DTW domain-containing protein